MRVLRPRHGAFLDEDLVVPEEPPPSLPAARSPTSGSARTGGGAVYSSKQRGGVVRRISVGITCVLAVAMLGCIASSSALAMEGWC